MNKTKFIKELSKKLSYPEEQCIIINEILERNFFLSKKSQDNIITEIRNKLNLNVEEATNVYQISVKIIKDEIKEKLKYPFKNQN